MKTINLYWHIKQLMGRVLTNSSDTHQEILVCIAEMMEKVDRLEWMDSMLAKKLENLSFAFFDEDNDPSPPI